MKKHLLFGVVLGCAMAIGSFAGNARASGPVPLSGWAWSSNIGWISFDSADSGAGGGAAYSVLVSTTTVGGKTVGTFSGYAWSPNVGWVSFNPSDLATAPACPGGSGAAATADMTADGGSVTGFVRVVSGIGDWGGCIELSGTDHITGNISGGQGVTYHFVPNSSGIGGQASFIGFAWEPIVLGWIDLSPGFGFAGVSCPSCGTGAAPPGGAISATCTASNNGNTTSYPNSLNLPVGGGSVTFGVAGIVNNSGDGNTSYSEYWNNSASPASTFGPISYTATGSSPVIVVNDSLGATSGALACPAVVVAQNPPPSSDITLLAYKSQNGVGSNSISVDAGRPAYLSWTTSEDLSAYYCHANASKPNSSTWSPGLWQAQAVQNGLLSNQITPFQITGSSNSLTPGSYNFQVICNYVGSSSSDNNSFFSSLFVKNVYAQASSKQSNPVTIIVTSSSEGEI